ncbi:glycosyl transferase family 90-domain-containing protein [Rhodotorula diobovata]|uniref:Glycosyl transferase family 90-domain-containing protein n=1 Tax=Rhodotorula diobovata TaxID=5288 RepID=A0A5C5FZ39_9BASI|nr:glycosyl transferase family 90-domain-containing protein [Rhodotorula diobovata]
MLRKRAAIVAEPADALAERVVADGEVASAPPASPTESDAAVPPPPPATLARRAVAPDEASPRTLPDRLHPISHLVARAEEEWDDMLRRQSQTLEQAVAEYRRRYKMNPPVGFDSWWRYAMQNRVILVDEYDQVHSDVLPFLSLPPSEFRRRVMSLSTDQSLPWFKQSFQLKVRDGAVTAGQGAGDAAERRDAVLDLLAEFSEMLPDLEARMSKGDEPMVVVSGEARERHERLARDGKLLGTSPAFEIAEPSGFTPWDSLCPPNSTARRIAQALPVDTPRGNTLQSFVSIEHVQAMDLCEHPEVRDLNGFTAWSGPRPYLLYPLFSFTKTSLHADLLLPSVSGDFFAEIGRDPVWEQKKQNRVLWRGETMGTYHSKGSGWRQSQRARLVALANAKDGDTTFHLADSTSDALRLVTAPTLDVSHHYFDVAYTGVPKQCSAKDTTCKQLQHEMRFDKWLSADEENKFKYVLDVDANYASGKFKRLMSSRSLVFKSTIFPEWWSKRIMPWYHYVPIQSDYSDLTDTAAFFIGAPDGTGSHDALAKRIAQQGKKWSEDHFREADMAAYTFRLLLEYARLLHREDDDLQSMDYKP